MVDMNDIGVAASAIGFVLSGLFGWRMQQPFRLAHLVVLAVVAIALAISLSFGAGFLHVGCTYLGLCAKTTDTTIWGVAFPLIANPAFWLMGFVANLAGPKQSG